MSVSFPAVDGDSPSQPVVQTTRPELYSSDHWAPPQSIGNVVPNGISSVKKLNHNLSSKELCWLQECDMIRREAMNALDALYDMVRDNDGWSLEKTVTDIKCYCKHIGGSKVVKMESIVKTSGEQLWFTMHPGETVPEWHPKCSVNQSLCQLDEATDVVYVISSAIGPISSRDFVSARKIGVRDGVYYSACKAIATELKPVQVGKVRGENGVSGIAIMPLDSDRCQLTWVINTHFKGWIPQMVVDQAALNASVSAYQQLQAYVEKKRNGTK